jgi:hypothetical protein
MEQPDMGATGAAAGSSSGAASTADQQDRNDSRGISDRARDIAGTTRDKLADVGGTVRDRASTLKDSLADALDSGADRIRHRESGGVALAGESGAGVVRRDERLGQMPDKVAGGMHATASWLREADLDNLKTGIETQVKEHPGRTLLIAVGLGYLLGKAFRK